jgi:hypothetical protein
MSSTFFRCSTSVPGPATLPTRRACSAALPATLKTSTSKRWLRRVEALRHVDDIDRGSRICLGHVEPDGQRLANSGERRCHRTASYKVGARLSFDRDRDGYCEDGHGRRDDERADHARSVRRP